MLTEKDYCDYKLVLELKELGYDYIRREGLIHLYDAQKWLREEKNIQIEVPISFMDNGVWKFSFRLQTREFYDRAIGEWDTFEEALSEGIKEAIKILKKK